MEKENSYSYPVSTRWIAWLTILLQLFIPLSTSFSPFITAVYAANNVAPANPSTVPYVLGSGETTETVAKKHAITLDELKKINVYRSFSRPFNQLKVGDEIDVPRKKSPFSVDNQVKTQSVENTLAGPVVAGARVLSDGNAAQSGERMLRSAATTKLNNVAQQWLDQFGTARVQLNVNEDFKIEESAVDTFVPLYDNERSVLFTQLGARNKDSRNTVNIGGGVRLFQDNWMYGVNTFFDNDLTGKNRRIGVGIEAWSDYLKLSANSYFGLTEWHQSRDFLDYNERPANGYDLRAEAYLPSYPQLGAKLMYEKYRGEDVALFGKDNRQKDPSAVTAGISYTPIPLLTFNAEYRAGKNGQNESNIGLQLNYQLGESWGYHITPSAVAGLRMISNNRYGLVERNNSIVLDYQKQNLVRLSLPESLAGNGYTKVTAVAQVTSTHALERIDWQAPDLISAGGVIKKVSLDRVEITLPGYQTADVTRNNYSLNAIAYDLQGNASNQATMLIRVNAPDISTAHSTLAASPTLLEANDTDTSVVTLSLKDSNGNPVTGQPVAFATTLGTLGEVTTDKENTGTYSAILTAGLVAGIATLTATVDGTDLNITPASVILNGYSGDLSPLHSKLAADPPTLEADGNSVSQVTLTLRDGNNNPVSGQIITFINMDEARVALARTAETRDRSSLVSFDPVVDEGNGTYTATLRAGIIAGTAAIGVDVGGTLLGLLPIDVILNGNSSELSDTYSTLVASPAALEANNTDTSQVTLTLRDNNNNPVSGQQVAFASTLGELGNVTESSNGVYSATLTAGKEAGTAAITSTVGGKALGIMASVILNGNTRDLSTSISTLVATPTAIEANGTDTSTVTLTLKDSNDNPVKGQKVVFVSTLGKMSAVTEAAGVYTTMLTAGTVAGVASITTEVEGKTQAVTASVTLNGNSSDLSTTKSTLVADPTALVADGKATSTVTLTLRDSNDNPVTGQTVAFSSTLGKVSAVTEDSGGVYTATLTAGTVAGTASMTTTVGGNALAVNASVTFSGNSSDLSTSKSTLVANPTALVADGKATSTVTLTLRDSNDNCCGQLILATALDCSRNSRSDSFGVKPPLYQWGLSSL